MAEKSLNRTSALVRGLGAAVEETETPPPRHERLDERGKRRQTLYLPPDVYEAIRDITIHDRISQQEFFRQAISRELRARGHPSWNELDRKPKKPGY